MKVLRAEARLWYFVLRELIRIYEISLAPDLLAERALDALGVEKIVGEYDTVLELPGAKETLGHYMYRCSIGQGRSERMLAIEERLKSKRGVSLTHEMWCWARVMFGPELQQADGSRKRAYGTACDVFYITASLLLSSERLYTSAGAPVPMHSLGESLGSYISRISDDGPHGAVAAILREVNFRAGREVATRASWQNVRDQF